MTDNLLGDQGAKRRQYLGAILASDSPKKLIVSGPGTGKTYTFGEVFRQSGSGDFLALTFIRNLVADMQSELGHFVEVKTFHAYCKKFLHQAYGGFVLTPFLTQIINEDTEALGIRLSHFDTAFQILDHGSEEISFYLSRGDYYDAVSFNDSVYRVLLASQQSEEFLPNYDQIVIDEFQDFNALEVAFIDELEKRGPILIVGDDDQAVYSERNSSPDHIRAKYQSGEYETFELPFCSRCPRVVVEATTSFINAIVEGGGFETRIERHFVPFLEDKDYENKAYPKIITANASTIATMAKLVSLAVAKIPAEDIADAHRKGYPCVLIVGQRQYLNPLKKRLISEYDNVAFRQASGRDYDLTDGYEILRVDLDSNLGWRIIAGYFLSQDDLTALINESMGGAQFVSLLPTAFVDKHSTVVDILRKSELEEPDLETLQEELGDDSELVITRFFPTEVEEIEPDMAKPSILLSSFQGCKGLSAGHVFIVGLNDGVMPKIDPPGEVADIEISKFVVAMTRTRKQLFLLSNWSDYGPQSSLYKPSMFINLIPGEFRSDMGYVKSEDAEMLINELQQSI